MDNPQKFDPEEELEQKLGIHDATEQDKQRLRACVGLEINFYEAQGALFYPLQDNKQTEELRDPTIDENGNVSNLYNIYFKKACNRFDRMKIKLIRFLRHLIND